MKLLQIDFPFTGPWGEGLSAMAKDLAADIAAEPGLIWKIWTENRATGEAGGIYLFGEEQGASKFLEKHTARLKGLGVPNIRARLFDVNQRLNEITRATFCRAQARSAE